MKKYADKIKSSEKKRDERMVNKEHVENEQRYQAAALTARGKENLSSAGEAVPLHSAVLAHPLPNVDHHAAPVTDRVAPDPNNENIFLIAAPVPSDPGMGFSELQPPADCYEYELSADMAAANSAGPPEGEDNEPAMDINPELLEVLGEYEAEALEWGKDLHEDIAKRFNQILLNGLKKEAREELLKRYLFPKNVSLSKAPTLNPELSAMLTEACRNRDKRLILKQDHLGKALAALGEAMTALLRKTPDIREALSILNDAGKLVADSHYAETDTRRSLVIPLVDKSLIETFKDRKRDDLLFGDNLGELVKNSQGIKKTGQLIQASVFSNGSNLNGKGPSSRVRHRGNQSYQSRGGGQRYQQLNRRRNPPPPARRYWAAPQPPARRQPPPPAQPARAPPPPPPSSRT